MGMLDRLTDWLEIPRWTSYRLEVIEETFDRCVVRGDACQVQLDLNRRIAQVGAGVRLPFAQFACVSIRRIEDDEDVHRRWVVSLVPHKRGSLVIGSSDDDVQASIAAAALSRHLGCPVQAL